MMGRPMRARAGFTFKALYPALVLLGCSGTPSEENNGTGGTSSSQGGTSGTGGAGGNTGGAAQVSYQRDVQPIFAGRCTYCHHPTSPIGVNLVDPFDPENGLVGSVNTWAVAHPEGNTPEFNVVPFEPENSFLIEKVENEAIDTAVAGGFMPLQMPRLTSDEVAALRQWITDGAQDDDFFRAQIRPIFGDETRLGAGAGKCSYCHHSTGMPPNLTDPFDAETGLVGVASIRRPSMPRVDPGSPETSFLIVKVEATTTTDENGAPMPMHYDPLTDAEIDVLRRWIAEGAQNN